MPAPAEERKVQEIKIGMIIRTAPLYREQDEMLVQWVGRDGNRVLVAGYCPKQRSVDGKDRPRPCHSVYRCYDYGNSFQVMWP